MFLFSLLSFALCATAFASPEQFVHTESVHANETLSRASAKKYDYIIVGSGAGGGPLAARLALNGFSVLLLEAGEDQGKNINEQVPAFHPYSTEDPSMRWDFFVKHYADPDRAARDSKMTWDTPSGENYIGKTPPSGSRMRGILYPRAGTLGGCSAHNAMVAMYPHNSDWQHIADITGDDSWQPAKMRKYFELLEKCEYCGTTATNHGKKGWLSLDRADVSLAVADAKLLSMIRNTATALGSATIGALLGTLANTKDVLAGDINSGDADRDRKEGLFQIPIHTSDKARVSSRDFVLSVANAVKGDGSKLFALDVQTDTLVTKVLFKEGTERPHANGVAFLQGKSLYRADPRSQSASPGVAGSAFATRDVILSGGAYNTPQLLKLSGIGPRAELGKFDIPVVKDLPGVGNNLQDHFEIPVVQEASKPFSVVEDCTFGAPNDPCLKKWQDKKGPYQSNGFFLSIVKKSSAALKDPDLLIFGGVAGFRGYYPGYSRDVVGHTNWTWVTLKAHTENRAGTVSLRSADPQDTPEIVFNYFDTGTTHNEADKQDLQAMMEGIGIARKTYPSPGPLAIDTFREHLPGTEITTESSLKQYIKDEAWGHHASCSCPIGADNDPMAVLDSKFRVRGVDGLRVVDASVFPKIPGFFVVIPTFMISEKAADVITRDAGKA